MTVLFFVEKRRIHHVKVKQRNRSKRKKGYQ